jgi:hypothetical protein
MEARMVLDEIPEAPRSIGRIAEYRGKVYLALLHLERERISLAPSKRISHGLHGLHGQGTKKDYRRV